jgi:Glutathione S-transferase, C-terminal domain
VKLSYPAIKPTCHKLLSPEIADSDCTVPIIEILQSPYVAINDSTPITELLNERFTPKDGYPEIKMIEEMKKMPPRGRGVFLWICYDVWANALDENDGSKEYFKRTREKSMGPLEDILNTKGGGDEAVFEGFKTQWLPLKERMAKEDGTGERKFSVKLWRNLKLIASTATYIDICDASIVRWVEAANAEKGRRLMNLYGDDTFTKLMNKVKPYEA